MAEAEPPTHAAGDEPAPAVTGAADPFVAPDRGKLLGRAIPVSRRLPDYRRASRRPDLIAGVTVAAMAVPSSMAYAQLAGLSPVLGLYALLVPAVACAFFSTSRRLLVRPEGAIAIMVGGAVAPMVVGDDPARYAALAGMAALLVGGIALTARALRLGWISDYVSLAVLVGYLHGVAATTRLAVAVCAERVSENGADEGHEPGRS